METVKVSFIWDEYSVILALPPKMSLTDITYEIPKELYEKYLEVQRKYEEVQDEMYRIWKKS